MLTKKLMLATGVALAAAGLAAPVSPAYVLDPGGDRLVGEPTSRTSQAAAKPKPTTSNPATSKPPLQP